MKLHLARRWYTGKSTIGELYVDGSGRECFILEDTVREEGPKVYGRTAIPAGSYRVIITPSPRFRRELPLLVNVPGFEGIRIHIGNKPEDTEGCLLPGKTRSTDWVGSSRAAFDPLFEKIRTALLAGKRVEITITNEQQQKGEQRHGTSG